MQVPAFLLRRLYVKGSLRNIEGGFAFDMHNTLGSGYAEEVLPLAIDGDEVAKDATTFTVDGASTKFSEVTAERPFTLDMDRTVTISVAGAPLADGKHRIGLNFMVTGMGQMGFEVTDAIGDVEDDGGDAAT